MINKIQKLIENIKLKNDAALFLDFEKQKQKIMKRNKKEILEISSLIITKEIFKRENHLISPKQAFEIAEIFFNEAKKDGYIDNLNRIIQND